MGVWCEHVSVIIPDTPWSSRGSHDVEIVDCSDLAGGHDVDEPG